MTDIRNTFDRLYGDLQVLSKDDAAAIFETAWKLATEKARSECARIADENDRASVQIRIGYEWVWVSPIGQEIRRLK